MLVLLLYHLPLPPSCHGRCLSWTAPLLPLHTTGTSWHSMLGVNGQVPNLRVGFPPVVLLQGGASPPPPNGDCSPPHFMSLLGIQLGAGTEQPLTCSSTPLPASSIRDGQPRARPRSRHWQPGQSRAQSQPATGQANRRQASRHHWCRRQPMPRSTGRDHTWPLRAS